MSVTQVSILAEGLLGQFAAAGVVGTADVQVARRLSHLVDEPSEVAALALALTVRALRLGAICVVLETIDQDVLASMDEPPAEPLPWPEPAQWLAALSDSPLVTVGAQETASRPLRLVAGRLYLERYWGEQDQVAHDLLSRSARTPPEVDPGRVRELAARLSSADRLGEGEPNMQQAAAESMATSWLTVLAGGPGTGKTTTVARGLAIIADQLGRAPRVALAAPSGRAAARLQHAVRDEVARIDITAEIAESLAGVEATTIHKLLGWTSGGEYRYHRGHQLPAEVVVVDEVSMVSLSMMARLLGAVRPGTRLVLVGDPDQLAPVEAGAVLADITAAVTGPDAETAAPGQEPAVIDAGSGNGHATPESSVMNDGSGTDPATPGSAETDSNAGSAEPDSAGITDSEQLSAAQTTAATDDHTRRGSGPLLPLVRLRHTWRFSGQLDDLADAIRQGDPDQVMAVLDAGTELSWIRFDDRGRVRRGALDPVRRVSEQTSVAMIAAARAGDVSGALAALARHRVLCAHRSGPYGATTWGAAVARWAADQDPQWAAEGPWPAGQALLVTRNDAELGVSNGDAGVVIRTDHGPRVAFDTDTRTALIAPAQLSDVQPLDAMTVHKAQGSQFDAVTVVLPMLPSPLLTRELLYTAVTRARTTVTVVAHPEAIRRAVLTQALRASGLTQQLREAAITFAATPPQATT